MYLCIIWPAWPRPPLQQGLNLSVIAAFTPTQINHTEMETHKFDSIELNKEGVNVVLLYSHKPELDTANWPPSAPGI